MGPGGSQRKMIAFLTVWLAVTASGNISAQAEDSKWDIAPVEEVPQMDVKLTAPKAKLVDDIMVDKQLAEADIRDGNFAPAIVSLKDVVRRLSKLLRADDIRILSAQYALAHVLVLDNKYKEASKVLRPALKHELEREKIAQKKERQFISEAERSSEGMETVAEFESRYGHAERLIDESLESAMHDRSMILFWSGRRLDALRLAAVGPVLVAQKDIATERSNKLADAGYIRALGCWGGGDIEGFRRAIDQYSIQRYFDPDGRKPRHDLRQALLKGLEWQCEKKYDEAQEIFEDAQKKFEEVISKGDNVPSKTVANNPTDHLNRLDLNLLKLFLGNNYLFKGEPVKAFEVFERVYEEAKRLDKGKPESVVYAGVYFAALDGMRSSVLARYTMSMDSASPVGLEDEAVELEDQAVPIEDPISKLDCPIRFVALEHPFQSPDTAGGEPAIQLSENDYRRLAGDLYTVAYQHKLKSRQKVARELFFRSLEVYEKHLPEHKREIAGLLYDLAESYFWSKQYDAATSVMSKCVAVRKEMDPVSRDTIASLNQLGRMYQSAGEGKEAVKCFREAMALVVREKQMHNARVYRLIADVGLPSDGINPTRLAAGRNPDVPSGTINDVTREKLSTEKLKRTLDTTYDAENIKLVCNWPLTRQLDAVAYAVSSSPTSERSELNDLWQVLADAYNIDKNYDEAYETSLKLLESKKNTSQTPLDTADLTDNLWQLAYICSVSFRLQEAKQYFDEVVKHHKPMNERTTGYLHYARALVNDSNGLAKEAVDDFRIAVKCLKKYLPTLHPLDEAEEIDHTRWLIYDIEQELKAKKKRGADKPDYYGAYESTKWSRDRFPLKICIDQTPEHGFGPRLHSSFTKSIDDWMSASQLTKDSPLAYELIDDKEKADIYLERVDSYDQIPYGSGGGATARHVMRDGKLTNDLDLVHLRVYCPTPDPNELSNYATAHLEALVLHELGHAFGLGHSSSGLDIMYWKSAAKNLSHRDKATLLLLYGCQADR